MSAAMEPRIQYAKTSDGVNIAYYAIGHGMPLVIMNLPNSHLHMEWQMADVRQTLQAAATMATVVRYDQRGFGLSDRNVDDFSIDHLLLDVEAVLAKLDIEQFTLVGFGVSSPLAIVLAARDPERVAKLVLWPAFARFPKGLAQMAEKLLAMDEADWEFASESLVRYGMGWSDEMSAPAAAALRESIAREKLAQFLEQSRLWDVGGMLHRVTSPTMIVHDKADKRVDLLTAREMASAIPDARIAILDAESRAGRMGQAVSSVLPFLAGRPLIPEQLATPPSGTAVILFADIADSTALTERLGDAAFRAKARDLDATLRTTIREHAGTPIEGKLLGDGVLAVFTSARRAIEAALACGRSGRDAGLPLHLGLHAGDVIREENNVYGGAVNIASRISGLSAPGEVLVSDIVRGLARTSAGVGFEDRGEQPLKGVSEAVRVWAVVKSG